MDVRTLAAGVLGVALGLLLIGAPDLLIRIHAAGRLPPERRGGYGEDGTAPAWGRWLVRLVGAGLVGAGLYFGSMAL